MKKITLLSKRFTLKKILGSIFIIAGILSLCSLEATAVTDLVDKGDLKIQIGGFAIGYLYNDSSRSLTEIQGSTPIARQGTVDGDNGRTQFTSRGTRLGFGVYAKTDGWQTKGFIEMDFLGYDPTPGSSAGNTEASFFNNPTFRLRHAYVDAQKNGWQILVGQYWSLFGWNADYALHTSAQPPVTGSIFGRTPQFRVMKTTDIAETAYLETAVALSRLPQRDAEIPALELGTRLSFKNRRAGFSDWTQDQKAYPMIFAVSGTLRKFETGIAGDRTTDKNNYFGRAISFNMMIPILASSSEKEYANTLALAGEFSTGQGYADLFPGYTGNLPQFNTSNGNLTNLDAGEGGYNADGIFSLVHLQSWNLQLQYSFPKGFLEDTILIIGYGDLYSNNIKNMVPRAGAVLYDESQASFVTLVHDFTKRIRVEAEYLHTETNYIDRVDGKNNRTSILAMFRF